MDDQREVKDPVVFLSHSSKDHEVVARLCEALESHGFPCWMAPRNILSSTEWAEAIMTGLEQSKVFLLVLSEHSNKSSQVIREITNAAHIGHCLVPFRIQDVKLSKVMQYFLSDVHWFDALTPPLESHFPTLVSTLTKALQERATGEEGGPAPVPFPSVAVAVPATALAGPAAGSVPSLSASPTRVPAVTSGDGPPPRLTNAVGMDLRLIPAGTFLMGTATGPRDETPPHRVTISRPFYLGVCPVTQAEFAAVLGGDPARCKGPRRPVENVSWAEAVRFCETLAAREGRFYRLPTEAEWEFACGAGSPAPFFWGDDFTADGGWCLVNAGGETHEVGATRANPHGLYDMAGNVFEWCLDWYDLYQKKDQVDPQGPPGGEGRCVRGGSFKVPPSACRTAFRAQCAPDDRSPAVGFRLCLPVAP